MGEGAALLLRQSFVRGDSSLMTPTAFRTARILQAQTVLKRSADDMIALGKLANPGEGDGQNPAYDAAFK